MKDTNKIGSLAPSSDAGKGDREASIIREIFEAITTYHLARKRRIYWVFRPSSGKQSGRGLPFRPPLTTLFQLRQKE